MNSKKNTEYSHCSNGKTLKISVLFVAVISSTIIALPVSAQRNPDRPFTVAFAAQPIEWSPLRTYSALEAQLYTAIYEGLVTYNPSNLRPVPGAAETWELSSDKKIYKFKLRETARFSDGSQLTADNFRETWIRMLDPRTQSPFAGLLDPVKGAREFRTGQTQDTSSIGIRAISKFELEIELNTPSAYFIQVLCHQSLVPMHSSLLNLNRIQLTTPIIGNGPYKILNRSLTKIEFEASDTYWDKDQVAIKKMIVLLSDEVENITEDYNSGLIQWLDSGADFSKLSDNGHILLTPQFSTTMLYYSNSQQAFRDPRVRKGLSLLIPFDELRSSDLYLVPSANLIPAIPSYNRPKGIEKQNPKEALQLLEEAGFPNGKGLPPITIRFPQGELSDSMTEILRKAWSGLEVSINVKSEDPATYYDTLQPQDFTIASMSWIGDYADPMTFLDLWYGHSSLNKSGYVNEEYDRLLDKSNTEQGNTRFKTLAEAEALLLNDAQVIPISHSPAFNVIDLETIGGWFENPLNIHPFKYLRFKALRPPRNIAGL